MNKLKIIPLLAIPVMFILSCRYETCMEPMDNNLSIYFYSKSTGADSAMYYLFAYGVGEDSILVDTTYGKSFCNLLFNLNSDTSQYHLTLVTLVKSYTDSSRYYDSITPGTIPDTIWKYKKFTARILDTLKETISVKYSRNLVLVSPECGFSYNITLDSVWTTKNVIDSIIINKEKIVRGTYEENIKIFL